MSSLNADEFRESQRRDWNSVSGGWKKWWQTIEQGASHISETLIDRAGISPGQKVLDIATGIGEPALSAALRVGESGHVIATDQADDMLDIARERAREIPDINIDFIQSAGEILDIDAGPFDAILCRWGLMFFPAPEKALDRIHTLLNREGRFSAAVWSTPDKVPGISLSMRVVQQLLDLPPPPPDRPGPFSLADRERLQGLFDDAGFVEVAIETIPVTFSMPSAQAFTDFTLDVSAPLIALMNTIDREKQDDIIAAITREAEKHAAADGSLKLVNETLCISGKRGT